MRNILRNFLITLRSYPLVVALNIAGLGVAIAVAYVIAVQVYYELSYNKGIKDAERIVGRNDIPQIIKENIHSIPIRVKIIDEENKFNQIIKDYVTENTGDRSILAVGNED